MMHVMSAPPSSAAAGAPAAAGHSGPSGGDGDFASILAAQARPATGESQAVSEEATALPSPPADEGEASGDPGVSSEADPGTLLALVSPTPVTVDVATPLSTGADGPSDDEGSNPARPVVESAAPADRTAGETTTTTSTTATASATEVTSPQPSVPPSAPPAQETPSTKPDQAQTTVRPPEALAADGGTPGPTRVETDTAETVPTTRAADSTSGAEQPAAASGRAATAGAPTATGTATVTTERVDGVGRRPAATERPVARVAAPPQADMAAAASATSDVDGAAPAPSRPAEGSQPVPSTALDRVMRAVEALENAPPPKRVSFEVDGLRLTVSLRGDEVNVAVRGGGDQLGSGWQRDLDGALRGRGLGLSDGQGSDTDRGDGRQHPDDRPPHRSDWGGPAFRRPTDSDSDSDTSTSLQL